MSDNLQIGQITAHWNAAGNRILKYSVEMYHAGLKEHKVISATEQIILKNKASLQIEKWEEKWLLIEEKRLANEEKEANIEEAEEMTRNAENEIASIENILKHTLSIDDAIDWEELKRKDDFEVEKPIQPKDKKFIELPNKPEKEVLKYNLFEKVFKGLKQKKIDKYKKEYEDIIKNWNETINKIEDDNNKIKEENLKIKEGWTEKCKEWEEERNNFYIEKDAYNTRIEELKNQYQIKNSDAIVEYCDMVLTNSEYPNNFNINFELEYNENNRILIVEYQLPNIDLFPTIKEVKYIANRKELKESYISEIQRNKMYDQALFEITLRTIHELFEADVVDALDAISFNGWVRAIDRGTGNEVNNCIITIQVQKDEFLQINLENVEPKACFKNLKGVSSSKLNTLTPVKPILMLSKTDKRFVDGYDVADGLNDKTNIAAMDWEDFEHLIRELFEKEFSSNGGEVKVTQASRDGGVDAVAFDPDPIRGGKIVIQAKRYTNTVGVSAVRDLYGTVMNEGATKGILVTTADYGPDAYDFAKDKPLTLLNGSNLLHLLNKHGHAAKIDIKEAKKILAEQEQ